MSLIIIYGRDVVLWIWTINDMQSDKCTMQACWCRYQWIQQIPGWLRWRGRLNSYVTYLVSCTPIFMNVGQDRGHSHTLAPCGSVPCCLCALFHCHSCPSNSSNNLCCGSVWWRLAVKEVLGFSALTICPTCASFLHSYLSQYWLISPYCTIYWSITKDFFPLPSTAIWIHVVFDLL